MCCILLFSFWKKKNRLKTFKCPHSEFAAGPPAQAQSQPAASASRDTSAADAPPDLDDQDFLAEFTKNMRALLSEDQLTPEAASAAPQSHAPASASGAAASAQTHQQAAGQDDVPPLSKKEEEDIRRYFSEALAKDFGDPGPQGDQQGAQRPPGISEADLRDAIGMIDEKWAGGNAAQAQPQASTATSGPQPSTSASSGDSFQDTLRATAERMRSSNTQVSHLWRVCVCQTPSISHADAWTTISLEEACLISAPSPISLAC